jgi:hypothetical protein
MTNVADWITAASSVISAAAIILIWRQTRLSARQTELLAGQITSDHDRSRREKAAELILEWSKQLRRNASIARNFTDSLSEEEALSLYEQRPFSVASNKESMIIGSLSGVLDESKMQLEKENNHIHLTAEQVATINWLALSYLNTLESILSGWRHNIADRDMIQEEFGYLVSPSKGRSIMKNYRLALEGKDRYPAIEEFAALMQNEHTGVSQGKKLMGTIE